MQHGGQGRGRRVVLTVAAFAAALASDAAVAQVAISDAWVRATVPGQQTTGAFMRLTASRDATLVAISSPVAKLVEIHASKQDSGVLRMHAVRELSLPAGKAVEMKPGGHHVMLMQLTRPLSDGDAVPLVLTVRDATGGRTNLEVSARVRPLTTAAESSAAKHSH